MAYSAYPSTRISGTSRVGTGLGTASLSAARVGGYPQVIGTAGRVSSGFRATSPVATSPTMYSRAPRVSSGVTAASLVSPTAARTTSFGTVSSARTVQPAVSARSGVRPAPATTVLGSSFPTTTSFGSPTIISSPTMLSSPVIAGAVQAKVIKGGIQGITYGASGYLGSAYAPTYYSSTATGLGGPSSAQAAYEAKHADDPQLSNLKQVKKECALKNVPIKLAAETFKAAAAGSGMLTRDQFFAAHAALLDSCGVPHPTPEVKNAVFDLFDRDDNNCIDMMELVCGISLLCYGNEDEKVEAVFLMFDENGDGYVSIEEMYKFLSTVFKIVCTPNVMDVVNNAGVNVANTDEMAKATTEECFQTADLNHDGKLSLDEFKKWFYAPRNDPTLLFHPVKNMLDD